MIRLPLALQAWSRPDFREVLKAEIERLEASALPLQQGLSASSHALDDGFSVMVIGDGADAATVQVRLGVFFSGVVAGCNCADDPTPVEAQNEYCEMQLSIDRRTAEATFAVLAA
ncbi:MAG: hypothetical protein KJ787_10380 [Gammaproteobacteria bacterium]|nr:hypothetical protein [Gammaproteobacteria bacterium]MBU1646728.1 hypothetical protein [Gammaproteobacteria bacterium]MBU1971761.1 hypothetical protein [Gammaproteobacteria bacterium]